MFVSTHILAAAMFLLVGQAQAQDTDTNFTDGGVMVNITFDPTDDQFDTNSSIVATPLPAPSAPMMPTTDLPNFAPSPTPSTSQNDMDVTFAPFPTVVIPPVGPQAQTTQFLSGVSDIPSTTPSDAPFFSVTGSAPATCSSYPACSNLDGDCCPTMDNVTLACCGLASVEETCSSNSRCVDEWGLTGSCCPTLTGLFLDCCETVPDECQDDTGNCTLISTREYVQSSAVRFQGTMITLIFFGFVAFMA